MSTTTTVTTAPASPPVQPADQWYPLRRSAEAVLAPLAYDPHVASDHPAVKLLAQIDEMEKVGASNATQ